MTIVDDLGPRSLLQAQGRHQRVRLMAMNDVIGFSRGSLCQRADAAETLAPAPALGELAEAHSPSVGRQSLAGMAYDRYVRPEAH